MFRTSITFLALTVLLLLVATASPATPQDTKGQIVSVDPKKGQFELKIDGNQKRLYKLDEDATTYINSKKAEFKDLRADDKVAVTDRKDGDTWYAIAIRAERPEKKNVGVAQETKGELVSIDAPKQKFEMNVDGKEKRKYMLGEDATTYINGKVAAFENLRVGDRLSVSDRKDEDKWFAIIIKCERK